MQSYEPWRTAVGVPAHGGDAVDSECAAPCRARHAKRLLELPSPRRGRNRPEQPASILQVARRGRQVVFFYFSFKVCLGRAAAQPSLVAAAPSPAPTRPAAASPTSWPPRRVAAPSPTPYARHRRLRPTQATMAPGRAPTCDHPSGRVVSTESAAALWSLLCFPIHRCTTSPLLPSPCRHTTSTPRQAARPRRRARPPPSRRAPSPLFLSCA